MALVIKKADKYLVGHSYATGLGYKFNWTTNIGKARRFSDIDLGMAKDFARMTRGIVYEVKNTRKELKALGKRKMEEAG